jgi:hypothetical protein
MNHSFLIEDILNLHERKERKVIQVLFFAWRSLILIQQRGIGKKFILISTASTITFWLIMQICVIFI